MKKLENRVLDGIDEICAMYIVRKHVKIHISLNPSTSLDDVIAACIYSYSSGLRHAVKKLGIGSMSFAIAGALAFAVSMVTNTDSAGLSVALLALCGGIASLLESLSRNFINRKRLEKAKKAWQEFQRAAALDNRARAFLEALRTIVQCCLDPSCTRISVRDLGEFELYREEKKGARGLRSVRIEIIPVSERRTE